MDELQKGQNAALNPAAAEETLNRVFRQFKEWGFTPPETVPLVFDFGLDNFMETGEVEFWIANEIEAGYCGKFLFVFDGQSCPVHHHKQKLETFFILFGTVKMRYEGEEKIMKAGDVLKVEREKDHGFTGIGPALLLEVSQPSILDDNYFLNRTEGFPGT